MTTSQTEINTNSAAVNACNNSAVAAGNGSLNGVERVSGGGGVGGGGNSNVVTATKTTSNNNGSQHNIGKFSCHCC